MGRPKSKKTRDLIAVRLPPDLAAFVRERGVTDTVEKAVRSYYRKVRNIERRKLKCTTTEDPT